MVRSTAALLLAATLALTAGCPKKVPAPAPTAPPRSEPTEAPPMGPGVTIRYFGHACFLVNDSEGLTVAVDPYNDGVGYDVPSLSADILLVTHDHADHSNVDAVTGSPQIFREEAEIDAQIPVTGVKGAHHEPGENEARGDIVMFRWEMDGIGLAHLSDLGTSLTDGQISDLGPIDILMIPVGGHFTIDAAKAVEAIIAIQPRVVIPMHYRTDATSDRLPIAPVDDFLAAAPGDWLVAQSDVNHVTIPAAEVEDDSAPIKVYVLNYR